MNAFKAFSCETILAAVKKKATLFRDMKKVNIINSYINVLTNKVKSIFSGNPGKYQNVVFECRLSLFTSLFRSDFDTNNIWSFIMGGFYFEWSLTQFFDTLIRLKPNLII